MHTGDTADARDAASRGRQWRRRNWLLVEEREVEWDRRTGLEKVWTVVEEEGGQHVLGQLLSSGKYRMLLLDVAD